MAGPWRLLERPMEHEAITSALSGQDCRGVVLVGPAGVGKTTLARAVTESLQATVHWAACTESSRSIPLGAFAQWVQPSAARDPIALIGSARESIVAEENTIVGVDDAHLLDQLSATLLHQLAVERSGRIVATVRSGEPVPDAVTALWKDGYLQRLELTPFSKQQSIQLIESVLGCTLEGLSADVIWESSGGNPLFLRNMVEGALEAGTLSEANGVWQLRGPTAVPSGLVELLDSRLERAGNEVLQAVTLLALCEPLDIDALSELAGEAAVDAAETQGLIRIAQDGPTLNARFSHPLLGDVIRRRVGTASARKLRGRIVQVLRARKSDSASSRIRLAELCIDSDQTVDVGLLITAAKEAVFLSNLPLGERLARAAFERGGGLQSAELLSRALLWQGRPEQADAVLARFSTENMDELQMAQWGIPRVSILFWSMGDVSRARLLLETVRARVENPTLHLIVEATESAMTVHENNIAVGIAAAERVLSDARAPKQAVDFAAFAAGLAMPIAGRGRSFEPIAVRCRAEQKATDGMIRVMVRYCDVLALTYTGELDAADRRVATYAQFSSAGQFLGWAIAKIMAGLVASRRGNFPDAIASFEQALAALNAETSLPWRLPARLALSQAYSAIGNFEEATRVLDEAKEHAGPHVAIHEPQRIIAKAWLAAAQGAKHTAIDHALSAANLAHSSGQFAVEAEALHHAARCGDRSVGGRLAALARQIDGPLVPIYAQHAAAVARNDPRTLDAISVKFENAGLMLSAADSSAQAAARHDHDGQPGKSNESAVRAKQLAMQCGGAATLAVRAVSRPLPVTAREHEVAALIAAGLSNKEIAERLSVSVRTVEGHIYRGCFKLGVADRDQLAKIIWTDPAN